MVIKYKYSKLYWFLENFEFLKVYFSPFKFFLPKLYVGKVAIGLPYYTPRKKVKATPQRAIEAAVKEMRATRNFNKNNPEYKRKEKSFRELYDEKMRCHYFVDKSVGFDFVGLRWKTKFDSYRMEHNPVWSFVFFKWQTALIFVPENCHHYWEMYLAYHYDTDKSKSPQERLKEAKEKHSCTWTLHKSNGEEVTTDYWKVCIKNKYLNL